MNKWYQKTGLQGDVVISTRIRFARNLNEFPFPCKLSSNKKAEVVNLVKDSLKELNKNKKEAFSKRLDNGCLCFDFGPGTERYYVIDEKMMKYLVCRLSEEDFNGF